MYILSTTFLAKIYIVLSGKIKYTLSSNLGYTKYLGPYLSWSTSSF